jgi:hypothetical protein
MMKTGGLLEQTGIWGVESAGRNSEDEETEAGPSCFIAEEKAEEMLELQRGMCQERG